MTTPTTPSPSADTPESVAARLRKGAYIHGHGTGALMSESADLIEAQAAEIAALKNAAKAFISGLGARLSVANDALAAERAKVEAMREALEPFLDAAAGMAEIDMPNEAAVLRACADHCLRTGAGRPLTFGDFRQLRAALSTGATQADSEGGGHAARDV